LENHYITEMWIVENPEIDKAKHLGFNVPKGTLMASIKVDNTEIWESLILTGKVAGFSLEGKFNHKIMDKQEEKQEFKSDRSIM
ncbi:XkdF-like putative serine protease domain-containing protein, partial [Loigolactobacillus coryniformis]|uniref:XkdF-like putative serine protease domain-containing protein n=1 Tax=Loigolactobacillus coryniformis TaxID=1610 RepID=UPI00201ADEA1